MKGLTIKDLPESKELDRKAMAMVRGGFGSSLSHIFNSIGDALGNAARGGSAGGVSGVSVGDGLQSTGRGVSD